ncbi:MAG: hypothetical protein RSD13_06280 [Clostridium sp.]
MNFEELTVIELLEITNKNIQDGLSVSQIGQLFKPIIKEDRIRKKLNKNGYKRLKDKDKTKTIFVGQGVGQDVGQIKADKEIDGLNKIKLEDEIVYKEDEGQCVANVVQEVIKETNVVVEHQQKKKLNDILSNYNILMDIIEDYKNNVRDISSTIEIRVPIEDDKSYKTSLRVNKVVLEQFKEFCSKHKEFSQKDLLSMALIEYMENHK